LVFGARAAQAMLDEYLPHGRDFEGGLEPSAPLSEAEKQKLEEIIVKLQAAMWAYAGLLREESTLRQGFAAQEACAAALAELAVQGKASRRLSEARAMSRVAHAILASALARTESRGAHFRNDFPRRNDARFQKHSVFGRDGLVSFEAW
jgi:L-aspartate oxidase